jgi:polyisoprenoid-binding protein YceI
MHRISSALMLAVATFLTACGGGGQQKETVKTEEAKKVPEKEAKSVTYKLNPEASQLMWEGRKVYQEDYSHNGLVGLEQGELFVKKDEITGGSFTVNLNKIIEKDLAGESEDSAKLVNHLKSEDFFHVKEHPQAKFEITGVKAATDKPDATHIVSGNLTLRGKANNIEFPASVKMKGDQVMAKATFTIDRTRWGVTYGAESTFEELTDKVKDKVIANDIKLSLDMVAEKKAMAIN